MRTGMARGQDCSDDACKLLLRPPLHTWRSPKEQLQPSPDTRRSSEDLWTLGNLVLFCALFFPHGRATDRHCAA